MISSFENKVDLDILFCGKNDGGKSVLTKRLLFGLGGLPDNVRDRIQNEADDMGKGEFAFAFWMDKIVAARERGGVIRYEQPIFFIDEWKYNLTTSIDAKTKHGIANLIRSNVAVLVVAIDSLLRCSQDVIKLWDKNVLDDGQNYAHLLNIFGVKHVIICINKMDSDGIADHSEESFNMARDHMNTMLEGIGFSVNSVPIIPISGWTGDNVLKKSEKMEWWDGVDVTTTNGEIIRITTLVGALGQLPTAPEANFKEPWHIESRYMDAVLKLVG